VKAIGLVSLDGISLPELLAMPTFPAVSLLGFVKNLFLAVKVPEDEASLVATSLVEANLCGHDSHGVMRAPQYASFVRDGIYKPGTALTILNETPAVLAADAGWGFGQVQAHRLMQQLLPKALSLGVAAGSLRHCGHTGRLGEYAELAAKHRLAFFGTVNSHGHGRRVAPPGGTEGRISTNPICFGVPTTAEPVVLDFGTSVAAEGKVRIHFQKQEPTPSGWLQDHLGQPTTDPGVLYNEPRGSLLPFGGAQAYKGFGLGLMMDLLAGGLSGGPCSNPQYPMAGTGNTVLFTLFNPAFFGGVDHLLTQADQLTEYVRGCPTSDPNQPITLPGEPEQRIKAIRQASGIPVPDGTWQLLVKAGAEWNVTLPEHIS
jgi:hydroxycarboxylate dehydrogenase B